MMEESISCPICLSSTKDEGANAVTFVVTKCNHTFCMPCVEHVLVKSPQSHALLHGGDNVDIDDLQLLFPTLGRCPMCRQLTSVFDLRHAQHVENSDGNKDDSVEGVAELPLVYPPNPDISKWPIHNGGYKQYMTNPIRKHYSQEDMENHFSGRGVIAGYGLIFQFRESTPLLEFPQNLKEAIDLESERTLNNFPSAKFTRYHFHEKTMAFRGSIKFENPVSNPKPGVFYEELDCFLQFSDNAKFIRDGYLRWKAKPVNTQNYPLDGVWEAMWENGVPVKIEVQMHNFQCFGDTCYIALGDNHCPRITFREAPLNGQVSSYQILPGTKGPDVGETLEWVLNGQGLPEDQKERIVWKRKAMDLNDSWTLWRLKNDDFVFQRIADAEESLLPWTPSYHSDTLWGNVFCQAFSVGLASYHFLPADENRDYKAYISYENPKTSNWPSLDNGSAIPSRVPFRNIEYDATTRTFKGDICWQDDYGTTWQNEPKWSYEIKFDPSFSFIAAGNVIMSEDTRDPSVFGRDLVYVNAALESVFVGAGNVEMAGMLVQWMRNGASRRTIQMLQAVCSSMLGNPDGGIFDFNI